MAADFHDWDKSDAWQTDHPVIRAFGRLRTTVALGKLAGIASLPARLSPRQRGVLLAALERLYAGGVRPSLAEDTRRGLGAMASTGEVTSLGVGWRQLAPTLGLGAGAFDPDRAAEEGRHHLVAQLLAMSPRYWDDPVQAILFTALQYGLEVALRRGRCKPEPLKTEALLHYIQSAVEHRVIPAMDEAGAGLPETYTLDLGTASMQEGRDLLAADLAVVAGVHVLGRPKYRIVLFQAKNATATGLADVGRNEGRQLDTFLSTGMGWYLFYPAWARKGAFITTVRPATEVFHDVWAHGPAPAFGQVDAYGGARSPGWDFASFVSIAMSSCRDLSLGRLFPDAETAAKALADDRRQPLAADIIAIDRTGRLALRDFIDATASLGYGDGRVSSVPSRRHAAHRCDEAGIPGDPFAPGW